MLNHLSWTSYFEAAILLLVIYYVYIGIRFYAEDIKKLFSHPFKQDGGESVKETFSHRDRNAPVDGLPEEVSYGEEIYPDNDIKEADELIKWVKKCVAPASNKPYAPDVLILQLKEIFRAHITLKSSPYRPAINEQVVTECERTGVAGLTEDEVDQWWSD